MASSCTWKSGDEMGNYGHKLYKPQFDCIRLQMEGAKKMFCFMFLKFRLMNPRGIWFPFQFLAQISEPVQQLLLLFIGKRYVLRDQLMVSDVDDQLILCKNFNPANGKQNSRSSKAVENDIKTYRKALFNDAFRRVLF